VLSHHLALRLAIQVPPEGLVGIAAQVKPDSADKSAPDVGPVNNHNEVPLSVELDPDDRLDSDATVDFDFDDAGFIHLEVLGQLNAPVAIRVGCLPGVMAEGEVEASDEGLGGSARESDFFVIQCAHYV
jgi:hypothetical protein